MASESETLPSEQAHAACDADTSLAVSAPVTDAAAVDPPSGSQPEEHTDVQAEASPEASVPESDSPKPPVKSRLVYSVEQMRSFKPAADISCPPGIKENAACYIGVVYIEPVAAPIKKYVKRDDGNSSNNQHPNKPRGPVTVDHSPSTSTSPSQREAPHAEPPAPQEPRAKEATSAVEKDVQNELKRLIDRQQKNNEAQRQAAQPVPQVSVHQAQPTYPQKQPGQFTVSSSSGGTPTPVAFPSYFPVDSNLISALKGLSLAGKGTISLSGAQPLVTPSPTVLMYAQAPQPSVVAYPQTSESPKAWPQHMSPTRIVPTVAQPIKPVTQSIRTYNTPPPSSAYLTNNNNFGISNPMATPLNSYLAAKQQAAQAAQHATKSATFLSASAPPFTPTGGRSESHSQPQHAVNAASAISSRLAASLHSSPVHSSAGGTGLNVEMAIKEQLAQLANKRPAAKAPQQQPTLNIKGSNDGKGIDVSMLKQLLSKK